MAPRMIPAIASPLPEPARRVAAVKPTIESTSPTGLITHATIPRNGMSASTAPMSATTNPAVAIPFVGCCP